MYLCTLKECDAARSIAVAKTKNAVKSANRTKKR